jgi:chemotaxis signal transduction protein
MSQPNPESTAAADLQLAPHLKQRKRFFSRAVPEGYAEDWARILEQPLPEETRRKDSVLEFRIANLHLAISSRWVKAVAAPLVVCPVPHRDNTAFLGLVAYAGEVIPCCSLARMLGAADSTAGNDARTIVLEERPGERWAFPVDAVMAISSGTLHDRLTAPHPSENSAPANQLSTEWSDCHFEDDRGNKLDVLRSETLFQRLQRATA